MRVVLRMAAIAAVLASMSSPPGVAAATPQGSVVQRSVWSRALGHAVHTLESAPGAGTVATVTIPRGQP